LHAEIPILVILCRLGFKGHINPLLLLVHPVLKIITQFLSLLSVVWAPHWSADPLPNPLIFSPSSVITRLRLPSPMGNLSEFRAVAEWKRLPHFFGAYWFIVGSGRRGAANQGARGGYMAEMESDLNKVSAYW